MTSAPRCVGCALGVAVAFGMVAVLSRRVQRRRGWRSSMRSRCAACVVAYALGVLLTFAIVAISAWRVSVLNIVAAVRGLPDAAAPRGGRRRVGLGVGGVAAGVALAAAGVAAAQATPFSLGVSIAVISAVPLARAAGVSARARVLRRGRAAARLVAAAVRDDQRDRRPRARAWTSPPGSMSGLMVVAGATWLIVYNADVLLGLTMRVPRPDPRARAGAEDGDGLPAADALPHGRHARHVHARRVHDRRRCDDLGRVPARGRRSGELRRRLRRARRDRAAEPARRADDRDPRAPGCDRARRSAWSAASRSCPPASGRPVRGQTRDYPVRGFDRAVPPATTFPLAASATGYGSSQAVWDAMRRSHRSRRGRPVRRAASRQLGLRPAARLPPDRLLHRGRGVRRRCRSRSATRSPGRSRTLTVIGVLADTTPQDMRRHLDLAADGGRASSARRAPPRPSTTSQLAPGVDPTRRGGRSSARSSPTAWRRSPPGRSSTRPSARRTRSTGCCSASWGSGSIVGVAALGVISARSVVERRQQIGVLRSIGFRRGMVQLSFLLESSFIALTAIARRHARSA